MTSEERDRWTIFHFSQNNAQGRSQADVPALLRRVADSIADLGDVDVQDLTFHSELDDDGEWWPSVTVYYHCREARD